jgi:hypothetical protein
MQTQLDVETRRVELDHRFDSGLDVTLWWECGENRAVVSVADNRAGESFELTVEDANARDAFEHPFAYAAFRGLLDRAA